MRDHGASERGASGSSNWSNRISHLFLGPEAVTPTDQLLVSTVCSLRSKVDPPIEERAIETIRKALHPDLRSLDLRVDSYPLTRSGKQVRQLTIAKYGSERSDFYISELARFLSPSHTEEPSVNYLNGDRVIRPPAYERFSDPAWLVLIERDESECTNSLSDWKGYLRLTPSSFNQAVMHLLRTAPPGILAHDVASKYRLGSDLLRAPPLYSALREIIDRKESKRIAEITPNFVAGTPPNILRIEGQGVPGEFCKITIDVARPGDARSNFLSVVEQVSYWVGMIECGLVRVTGGARAKRICMFNEY